MPSFSFDSKGLGPNHPKPTGLLGVLLVFSHMTLCWHKHLSYNLSTTTENHFDTVVIDCLKISETVTTSKKLLFE